MSRNRYSGKSGVGTLGVYLSAGVGRKHRCSAAPSFLGDESGVTELRLKVANQPF